MIWFLYHAFPRGKMMHFLLYMFSLLSCMRGAMLFYVIRTFGHKFPNDMPEKVQRRLTVVIKSTKKCPQRIVEKIAYIENSA